MIRHLHILWSTKKYNASAPIKNDDEKVNELPREENFMFI